jgi:hypothetical protein
VPSSLAEVEQKEERYLTMPVDYESFQKLILESYGS